MRRLLRSMHGFGSDERGSTAVEYGVIATVLAIGILPAISNTTSGISSLYQSVMDSFAAVGM